MGCNMSSYVEVKLSLTGEWVLFQCAPNYRSYLWFNFLTNGEVARGRGHTPLCWESGYLVSIDESEGCCSQRIATTVVGDSDFYSLCSVDYLSLKAAMVKLRDLAEDFPEYRALVETKDDSFASDWLFFMESLYREEWVDDVRVVMFFDN